MIREVLTSKGTPAITSDQWHVVHSRLVHVGAKRPYVRTIHCEHAERSDCQKAAKALRVKLAHDGVGVPEGERDEVFIRHPNYKSLKCAKCRRADG